MKCRLKKDCKVIFYLKHNLNGYCSESEEKKIKFVDATK